MEAHVAHATRHTQGELRAGKAMGSARSAHVRRHVPHGGDGSFLVAIGNARQRHDRAARVGERRVAILVHVLQGALGHLQDVADREQRGLVRGVTVTQAVGHGEGQRAVEAHETGGISGDTLGRMCAPHDPDLAAPADARGELPRPDAGALAEAHVEVDLVDEARGRRRARRRGLRDAEPAPRSACVGSAIPSP